LLNSAMSWLCSSALDKETKSLDSNTKSTDKNNGASVAEAGIKGLIAGIATAGPIGGIVLGAACLGAAVGMVLTGKAMAAMATGGVVTGPTVALVGEGRYPEAVVPLGSSPQFRDMKQDIATAVIQGLAFMDRKKAVESKEVVLNLDGTRFGRAIIAQINQEYRRKGMDLSFS